MQETFIVYYQEMMLAPALDYTQDLFPVIVESGLPTEQAAKEYAELQTKLTGLQHYYAKDYSGYK